MCVCMCVLEIINHTLKLLIPTNLKISYYLIQFYRVFKLEIIRHTVEEIEN